MNYINKNKKYWNALAHIHPDTDFYQDTVDKFSQSSLPTVDRELLGNITDKSLLHLQCHFGQDSLSLAQMGANVVGLDFSDVAIQTARKLNKDMRLNAQFICSDVYKAHNTLITAANENKITLSKNDEFDIIYTSYGTIGWLPELTTWAENINKLLKLGGTFIIVDFHPFIWMLDEKNYTHFAYTYFNKETISETTDRSYTGDKLKEDYEIESWNHPISDIIQSLLLAGLSLQSFQEYDYSPYPCFPNMKEIEHGKYQFDHLDVQVPMIYAMKFTKN